MDNAATEDKENCITQNIELTAEETRLIDQHELTQDRVNHNSSDIPNLCSENPNPCSDIPNLGSENKNVCSQNLQICSRNTNVCQKNPNVDPGNPNQCTDQPYSETPISPKHCGQCRHLGPEEPNPCSGDRPTTSHNTNNNNCKEACAGNADEPLDNTSAPCINFGKVHTKSGKRMGGCGGGCGPSYSCYHGGGCCAPSCYHGHGHCGHGGHGHGCGGCRGGCYGGCGSCNGGCYNSCKQSQHDYYHSMENYHRSVSESYRNRAAHVKSHMC